MPVSRSSAIAVPVRSLFSSETALLVVLTGYIVVLGLWPLARLFVEALLPAPAAKSSACCSDNGAAPPRSAR